MQNKMAKTRENRNQEVEADQCLREASKIITTDDRMTDIGLELSFTSDEIQAIRTDNRYSIFQAGYQLLLEWRKRLGTSVSVLWHHLEQVFEKCGLGNTFREIVQPKKKNETKMNVEVCPFCNHELHSSHDGQQENPKRPKSR